MINEEIFTEQAEYLSLDSFEKWSTKLHEEANIIRKLSQSGAKLITGPRGCGKTTLFLKVNQKLLQDKSSTTLPIYVNFKSSLKLEPLYRNNTNAAHWFNQWLLHKVLYSLYESIENKKFEKNEFSSLMDKNRVDDVINLLELGNIEGFKGETMTSSSLIERIEFVLSKLNIKKCVLLLDDAGHAFSSEQQQDFFEFFREIKTKNISPKAAVYPGVTNYSSSFHIGHDAEEIDVWLKPNSEGYLEFMHSVLRSRFGQNNFEELLKYKNSLNLLCYAAYGIPRSLLNMISSFYKSDDSKNDFKIKLQNKGVLSAIKNNYNRTYQIYDSLRIKLPMYEKFIDIGGSIYERFLNINKDFNRGNNTKKQSSTIAIKRPINSELLKVLGFFQYAGLLSYQGISNRGNKGVYELFDLHYSSIIDRNVFFSSRGINFENYCFAFENRPNHHYPRHSASGILEDLGNNIKFELSLPSCPNCNTPRASEESKFCANCGVKLKDASIFESIVKQDISLLPITENRARSIKTNSNISTVKDIIMDTDNKQLFKVPQVGPYWAKKIKSYAEEFFA
ncbi:hypothetical protein WIW50_11520 [Flavobacteriaceae bacterium 3-367]